MTITRVIGPLDPEAGRWAASLNDPACGRLAVIVPPSLPSVEALMGEILVALGKSPEANPRVSARFDTAALCRAWLLGHRIDRLILIHADWLSARIASAVCAFVHLLGIDLIVCVGSGHDAYEGWTSVEVGWTEFVEQETRQTGLRDGLASDPARHQQDPIGRIGLPVGRNLVQADPIGPVRAPAFAALLARLQRDGRTEPATARSLVQVLDTYMGADLPAAASGAAAALRLAGWELAFDRATYVASEVADLGRWCDLRTGLHPYQPAVVGLIGAGLWAPEIAMLPASAVASDGSSVTLSRGIRRVPPGAQAYLVAQLALAPTPDHPFIHDRGHPMSPRTVTTSASATLSGAGVNLRPDRFIQPRAASARRLARLGLVLRPAEPQGNPIAAARRCGTHHLPGNVVIGGVALSHSHRLCQSPGPSALRPWEIRPPSEGYRLEERERSPLGVRIAAVAADGHQSELVGLVIGGEYVWLQTGQGDAPVLSAIVRRLERDYPSALGLDPRTVSWAPSIR